jgi:diadenosine tetraphosphate (Ap4A) HIT family hydrolase
MVLSVAADHDECMADQPAPLEEDCLICRQHRGQAEVPGGELFSDELIVAYHCPPWNEWPAYLGHLLVTPREHLPDFAALAPDQAAAMGQGAARGSAALRAMAATKVYLATVGHGAAADHLHLHLMPRWPETPIGVAWHAVDEWDGARKGRAWEIERFVNDLRDHL